MSSLIASCLCNIPFQPNVYCVKPSWSPGSNEKVRDALGTQEDNQKNPYKCEACRFLACDLKARSQEAGNDFCSYSHMHVQPPGKVL